MNEKNLQQRRRQYILDRARYRQTLIRQRDVEGDTLLEEPSAPSVSVTTPSALPTPTAAAKSNTPSLSTMSPTASEFEHHHNVVRLYIAEQFEDGKNSREIAEMIGLTPWRITRWYNQVRNLPPAARLWTPLLTPSDIKRLQREAAAAAAIEAGEIEPSKPRERRPSREEIKATRKALKAANKANQLAEDQKQADALAQAALPRVDNNEDVARRVAAAELYRNGWSLSRVARALTMDVSTVSRWMSRVRSAGEAAPEEILGIGQDKRGSNQDPNKPPAKRGRPARTASQLSALRAASPRRASRNDAETFQLVNTDTAMGKRAIATLRDLFSRPEGAPVADAKKPGDLLLPVRSATERERVNATLSLLGFVAGRPTAKGTGFVIPLSGKVQTKALLDLLK